MSFAADHVAAVDAQLDQIPLSDVFQPIDADNQSAQLKSNATGEIHSDVLNRVRHLQSSIKSLSPSNRLLAHLPDLLNTLRSVNFSHQSETYTRKDAANDFTVQESRGSSYEHELEWLLLGKITNHAYGLVLDSLIRQSLPLSNEIWYWNQVINSGHYLSLYTLQTSPLRFWAWSQGVFEEARNRGGDLEKSWRQFYSVVRGVIRDRNLSQIQMQLASPLVISRRDIRGKLASLTRARLTDAAGIGYLLSSGFNDKNFKLGDSSQGAIRNSVISQHNWKVTITNSISVMDGVLTAVGQGELQAEDFEGAVQLHMTDDPWKDHHKSTSGARSSVADVNTFVKPFEAAKRLEDILSKQLPVFLGQSVEILKNDGRPSRLIRYWLPATILLLSSSTILRFVANRRAELVQWVRDLGSTTIDFWRNWIIEPIRKVIGTIRHDEESEVSIMSKRSLEGDRESLERMVVDFAIDNPHGPALSDQEIGEIRTKVQEGDVTPVLMAYERELKSPLYGSIRGNLIRTLLIQVQKTKVDVEVAMRGIDNLLKSQELVFGFVGLTPGILVCLGVLRWVRSLPGSRRHSQQLQKQSQAFLVLRNIDRILTSSSQSDTGMLSFKEYGLLVCEAVVLRDVVKRTFPKQTFEEFLQDFNDLIDSKIGVGRQTRVADRIRWAYAKWL